MIKRCLVAENQKLHGAAVWLAFLIVPIFPAVMGTFNYQQNIALLQSAWYSLWTQHTLFYATFFFAPLVGVYAAYLWRLEHFGHNWNLIMAVPIHPIDLFLAKFLVVFKVTLLTQGWVFLLFFAAGKLVGLPGLPPAEIVVWLLRGTVGSVPVIALQLLLSMRIRSFAVPVLVALGGSVGGLLMNSAGYGLYCPYSLPLLGMNANANSDKLTGETFAFLASVAAFTLLFFALAQFFLTKRDVNAE
ncbi:MAG: ABC transporter permease [Gemmiger sp.]|nr:ABC transporter permease [Gemmiger sp.]